MIGRAAVGRAALAGLLSLPAWLGVALACGSPAGDAAGGAPAPAASDTTLLADVPFEVHDQRVYVPVEVAGPEGSRRVWMILDTGAGSVSVDAGLAAAVGAGVEWTGTVRGAGTATLPYGRARGISVALGGIELAGRSAFTSPLDSVLSPFTGRPEPGVVGGALFGGRIVEIDFEARRLRVRDPAGWRPGAGHLVPIGIEGGRPVADLEITLPGRAPEPARALIDLGAKPAALFTHGFGQRLGTLPPRVEATLGAGVGGETRFGFARLARLAAGDAAMEDAVVGFAGPGMLPERYDALLGFEFLRRHRVVFDYAGGRMVLDPTPAVDDPDGFDASGLFVVAPDARGLPGASLAPRHRRIEVLRVVPGGPAERAGVRPGDRVLVAALDGAPLDLSVAALREAFRAHPGEVAALTLLRDGRRIEVGIRLTPLV